MATESKAVQGTVDLIRRRVVLEGMTPIMFDRYAGDNETKIEPWQKLYLAEKNLPSVVGLPSLNIMSFLSAQNTKSAPKRLLDPRKYRKTSDAFLSFVLITPEFIPFMRGGKPIRLTSRLENAPDPESGIYLHRAVARLKDGIPNPKVRPVVPLPWSLEFTFTMFPNREVQEAMLATIMREGGIALGLGTWRGVYGKFSVAAWDEIK